MVEDVVIVANCESQKITVRSISITLHHHSATIATFCIKLRVTKQLQFVQIPLHYGAIAAI